MINKSNRMSNDISNDMFIESIILLMFLTYVRSIVTDQCINMGAAAGGDGSPAAPYNDLASAAAVQSLFRSTIYVIDSGVSPLTVSSGTVTLNPDGDVERVLRYVVSTSPATSDLIDIATGGTVIVSGGAIDGNGKSSSGPLFNVTGGTLIVNAGLLTGSVNTGNGGAIAITSGTATMTGGVIKGNSAALGNGVYVGYAATGAFALAPAVGADLEVSDVIYLTNGAYISANFTNKVTGNISVTMANDAINQNVAQRTGAYIFTSDDVNKFQYIGATHTFQSASFGQRITIAS